MTWVSPNSDYGKAYDEWFKKNEDLIREAEQLKYDIAKDITANEWDKFYSKSKDKVFKGDVVNAGGLFGITAPNWMDSQSKLDDSTFQSQALAGNVQTILLGTGGVVGKVAPSVATWLARS